MDFKYRNNQFDDQYITWNAFMECFWYVLQFLQYESERNAVGSSSRYLLISKGKLLNCESMYSIPLFKFIITQKTFKEENRENSLVGEHFKINHQKLQISDL